MTSAIEIHAHLLELQPERTLASIEGLAINSAYMAEGVYGAAPFGSLHLWWSGWQLPPER